MRVERWTIGNGLTVLYQQDKDFPLVYATLLFRGGSRSEDAGSAGLCSMTVDLLMQGTRRRDARELARAMESVGASIGTQVHEDYAEAGFVVPAHESARAFGVLAEVLREPSFPPTELVKEKAHVLASLISRKDAIFNVACDHLNARLYGDHPYGRPVEGTLTSVKKITRADLNTWHQSYLRPEKAILSLVGPMPLREMERLVERYLRAWKNKTSSPLVGEDRGGGTTLTAATPIPAPPHIGRGRLLCGGFPHRGGRSNSNGDSNNITVRSSFEQAYLMVGYPAPSVIERDHIPLKVLNTLLGGGMSSRLFVTLREKHSLAYEVSSFYPTRLDRSQWVIYLGLPHEKLALARERLDALLKEVARKGPTITEVLQAKAMIRGAFLMDQQSRRRQGWYKAFWEFMGRGPRYGEEFMQAVEAVTPKQLQGLLQMMMDQPRVTVTVVPK